MDIIPFYFFRTFRDFDVVYRFWDSLSLALVFYFFHAFLSKFYQISSQTTKVKNGIYNQLF